MPVTKVSEYPVKYNFAPNADTAFWILLIQSVILALEEDCKNYTVQKELDVG